MQLVESHDVAVIGGGLAGLTAAAYIARGGRSVTVYERASHVGGMAATEEAAGFHFNFGPHAFYLGGVGREIADDLGIAYPGKTPVADRALRKGRLHLLPVNARTLVATRLIGPAAKLELGAFLARLPGMETEPLDTVTLNEFLATHFRTEGARQVLRAVTRVSSYSNDPEHVSAGALLGQLQAALKGVRYIDGGWQTMVDSLRANAEAAGARIVSAAHVAAIERNGRVTGIRLANGEARSAAAVIVAASPRVAFDLTYRAEETVLGEWAEAATPMRAACLDVALRRLPSPGRPFALGIDTPVYLSVHSEAAKGLAPGGMALISTMKYLSPGEHNAEGVAAELEAAIDSVHPGWRDVLVKRRYLPNMIVSHWSPLAALGGLPGRPGPAVPGVKGLFVTGDWVGAEGMLTDAVFASARRAAGLALAAAHEHAIGVPTLARA